MKILIPIYNFGKGGGNRVISQLANSWIDRGVEVAFLCLSQSSTPYFPTKAKILWMKEKGGEITEEQGPIGERKGNILTEIIALTKGINKIAKDYDVILATHSFTSWAVYLTKSNSLKAYYIQAYETVFINNSNLVKRYISKLLIYRSYKLPLIRIVNSPIYYEFNNLRANKFVPPGLDFSQFFAKDSETLFTGEVITLGCIGRIESFKGGGVILQCFEQLRNKGYKVALKVAFGSPSFTGEGIDVVIPNGDAALADFYRSLDIMLAPATFQYGAYHYPVLEAMACGVPVVTTSYLPANESNAWLVNPHDADSLLEAVLEILSNKEEAKNKSKLAIENVKPYSWYNVGDRMLRILSKGLKDFSSVGPKVYDYNE